MSEYKNILLGVELLPENDAGTIKVALEMAKKSNANVHLVHAIEYISNYGAAYGMTANVEMETLLLQNAKKEMQKLAEQLGIPQERTTVEFGPAKFIILRAAEKIPADLIVVGSHGRHGVRLLLGSTANGVLHGAKCDVLAVRLKK